MTKTIRGHDSKIELTCSARLYLCHILLWLEDDPRMLCNQLPFYAFFHLTHQNQPIYKEIKY